MCNINTLYSDLNLDFNENRSLKIIRLKQNESGTRKIRLTLSQNGAPITLTGTETVTYSASINNIAVVANAGCSVSNNTQIIIPVTSQLTALAGGGTIDVKIALNSDVIYTATFRLDVEKSVVSTDTPDIVPTSDFIAELKSENLSLMADYIKQSIDGLHPDYEKTYLSELIDNEMSTLYGENPFYILNSSVGFRIAKDGLLIWQNRDTLIPPTLYSFAEVSNGIKIEFHLGTFGDFQIGNTIYFTIYKKPETAVITHGITTVMANGTSDSIYGIATEEAEE